MVNSNLEAVRELLFRIREELEELQYVEYPVDAPKKILDHLLKVFKQIEVWLGRDDISALKIKRLGLFLAAIHRTLWTLDRIKLEDIPIELFELLEDVLDHLNLSDNVYIYIKPIYEFNYGYMDVFKFIDESLSYFSSESNTNEDKTHVAMLMFPITQKENILLNSVLSHEMGHLLNDLIQISDEIIPKIEINKKYLNKLIDKVRSDLSKIKARKGDTEIPLNEIFEIEEGLNAQLIEDFTKILVKWLDELISDCIAIHLFGPSYFLALVEMAEITHEDTTYSSDHPPLFIRVDLMLRELEDHGYVQALQEFPKIRAIIDYYKEVSKKTISETDLKGKILEESIKKVLDDIISEVNSHILPYYTAKTLENEINALVSRIKELVPPNEIVDGSGGPVSVHPVSIINAGSIAKIEYMDEMYSLLGVNSEAEKHEVKKTLNKLVIKGLELHNICEKVRGAINASNF